MEIVRDIIVSASAIATVLIAFWGLRVWKSQLKGTNEYKLSEQILEKTYNLEDKLRSARGAWVSSGELAQREQEKKIREDETDRERMIRNEAYALWKRLEPVFKAVSELKVVKFKAMALWKRESVQDIDNLIKKAFELSNAQSIYFLMKFDPSTQDHKTMDRHLRIVYEMGKEDEYWKGVEGIVSKIEDKFQPYLE